jgi:hypothetical protein
MKTTKQSKRMAAMEERYVSELAFISNENARRAALTPEELEEEDRCWNFEEFV